MLARDDDPFVDVTIGATTARATVRRAHAARLCAGHFPDDPLLPGALMAGMLAELGARLLGGRVVLASVVRCVFRRRVRPDDDIVLLATRTPATDTVEAEVRIRDGTAAVATLRFVAAS